jgi:hypothetical protein
MQPLADILCSVCFGEIRTLLETQAECSILLSLRNPGGEPSQGAVKKRPSAGRSPAKNLVLWLKRVLQEDQKRHSSHGNSGSERSERPGLT